MPSLIKLRFQKYDKYANPVFIASNSNPDEKENYEILSEYAQKLVEKQYDTYLPIYQSVEHDFCSIRFKKGHYSKLLPRATYDISFAIKTITKDNKIYVNCYLDRAKMNSKPSTIYEGEELEL